MINTSFGKYLESADKTGFIISSYFPLFVNTSLNVLISILLLFYAKYEMYLKTKVGLRGIS